MTVSENVLIYATMHFIADTEKLLNCELKWWLLTENVFL
jgi:hypothetical protein